MTRTRAEELVGAPRRRYAKASRSQKSQVLDEFVAVTGFHRKAAIRRLRGGRRRSGGRQGRPPQYTPDVVAALLVFSEVRGCICSKRLGSFLPEAVALLNREGKVMVPADVRKRLIRMSPATIDHLLAKHRRNGGKGRCTTKPGTLLRSQVAVRAFADGTNTRPGFLEIDLVAHCDETTAGEFVHTLSAVDVATRRFEPVALPNRSHQTVEEALKGVQAKLPFPLLGITRTPTWPSSTGPSKRTVTRMRSRAPAVGRTRRTTRLTSSRRIGRWFANLTVTTATRGRRRRKHFRRCTMTTGCT